MHKFTHSGTRDALLKAVRGLLSPLARLLIQHHITFPAMRELLKTVYVETAARMIRDDGEEPSNSRLFILTGVHRKDIKRLLEAPPNGPTATFGASLGGEIIARWCARDEFIDERGQPRPLLRTGTPDEPGFEQLVTQASKDIRPRAILDEWLRQGLVSIDNERVRLNEQAFVPGDDFDTLCYYLQRNIHDHLAAATHNLRGNGDPMLERSVYYGHLSAESIQQLRAHAYSRSIDLLSELNRMAMRLHEQDQQNPAARHRFRYGCYWHEQEKSS